MRNFFGYINFACKTLLRLRVKLHPSEANQLQGIWDNVNFIACRKQNIYIVEGILKYNEEESFKKALHDARVRSQIHALAESIGSVAQLDTIETWNPVEEYFAGHEDDEMYGADDLPF